MKRRVEATEELIHDVGRNTIYCEAGVQKEDVLYQGSEDEYYESAAARRLQYEAAGQRFLNGRSAFVLTANLKGPFDSESGWENPWISKSQAEKVGGFKRKAKSQTPLQKGTAKSLVGRGGPRSNSQECVLPSPESLVQSVEGDHLDLEEDVFDHVRKWRLQVKPMVETESRVSGEHSPDQPKGKRSRGSEWLQSRKNKRARTDPTQLRVTRTPDRRSFLTEQAETPCNRPKLPQSSPALRQTQDFITPSTRHSSVRKLSTFSRMKRSPRDELGEIQHETSGCAQRQRVSSATRVSPKRNVRRGIDGQDANSEDELSVTPRSAKTLIPELRNGHTRRSFSGWPKVTSDLKEIEATPETTMAEEEHDGYITNDVVHDSTREETTSAGSDCTDEIAREATGEVITDRSPTGSVDNRQPPSMGMSNYQRMQLGRLRNRSITQSVRNDLAAGEEDEIEVACGQDDAVSTSSLSSLHSLRTPFGSSVLHWPSESDEIASSDKDDLVSASSLSSLHEPFSPWVSGLSVMRSELGEIKYHHDDVAKSSSPLSELSESSSWSGISDRILQIDNGPIETPSIRSEESKQRRILDNATGLPYRQLRRSPSRRRMRSPARLRSGRLRVAKPIKGHSMHLRNRSSGHLTKLTSKPEIRVRQANPDDMNSVPSSNTSARPNSRNKVVRDANSGLSVTQHAVKTNSTTRTLFVSRVSESDRQKSDAESSYVSKPSGSNTGPTSGGCAVHLVSTPRSPSAAILSGSAFWVPLSEASVKGKAVERPTDNGPDVSMDSLQSSAGAQVSVVVAPELERNTQQDTAGGSEHVVKASCTSLRVDHEHVLAESPVVSSETNAAIPTSGASEDMTTAIVESSKESPDRSNSCAADVSASLSMSRSQEEAVGVSPSTDAPVSYVMPPRLHPPKSVFPGSSDASNSQGQTRVFALPRTPEPEFTVKSFASFMSPSPNQRNLFRPAPIRLSSSGRHGILRVPRYPTEPKKRVSWATLPEENEGRSPVLRPASPPPGAPMEELPLSSVDKFREHFHALVHRAERLKGVRSREASFRDEGHPSWTTGSDTPTSTTFESEESGQSQHGTEDSSQNFVFDLDDIFDEMSDVLKTWNVDNELEVARKSTTVL